MYPNSMPDNPPYGVGISIDEANKRFGLTLSRRARLRTWWRKFIDPYEWKSKPLHVPEGATRAAVVTACAESLYDNRLGWSDNRSPHAPRAFWGALGLALGLDVSWITDTATNSEDARLTLQAAHTLLHDAEARLSE